MNEPAQLSFVLPKPGRALWAVMITLGALGIFTAFLAKWTHGGAALFTWLWCEPDKIGAHPWGLFTSGLLTDPDSMWHLAFSLLGLYFLAPSLEERWGGWRFVRFLLLSVLLGNLMVLAVARVVPLDAQTTRFHPGFVFGPTAAVIAVAVAWSREFAQSTVSLFFFLPIRGKVLFWVTLGFCVLDVIYLTPLVEGVMAPFGGVVAGLLFGGSPSLARKAWLHVRLAVLRRKATRLTVDDVLPPRPKRRPRPGSPPLRVVSGGLDEVLKNRTPPKDKRYLN